MNAKQNKAQKTTGAKKVGFATIAGALFGYVMGWAARDQSTHIPADDVLDLYITPAQVDEIMSNGYSKISFDTRRGGVTVSIIDDTEYPDND